MRFASKSAYRCRGVSLVEFTGALVFGLPLALTIFLVIFEANYYFTIRVNINSAARMAARSLAVEYGKDHSIANTPDGPKTQAILENIRIKNFVADNAQFSSPIFNETTPSSVTISCSYPVDGKYGLPKFPNPDPLNMQKTLRPRATATFATE